MSIISEREKIEKESVRSHWIGYCLHNLIIKRLFSYSSYSLKRKLLVIIKNKPKTVLDVSCGDDDFIEMICKKYQPIKAIANDLSPRLSVFALSKETIIERTALNMFHLPFREKFDLVIFKNTLHHIPDEQKLKLLNALAKISRQLLVVDIENPANTSLRAYIWNLYYRFFLGDQGDFFLDANTFENLLRATGKKVTFGSVETIKGRYVYGYYVQNN